MDKFPKHLEPQLLQVAIAATTTHPKGHLTKDVVERVAKLLSPMTAKSLRYKMKRLLKNAKENHQG